MIGFYVKRVMKKLGWASIGLVSLAWPALADTYYIDNPSLICKAHFKTSFSEFVTQDGDDFVLEFDEERYQSKAGLFSKFQKGFRYNGVIEGTNAAMLLNWPKDSEKGILTVLSTDYPCRASYGKEQPFQTANFDEAAKLPAEGEPEKIDEDASFSDTSKLRSEINSMFPFTDGTQGHLQALNT